MSLQLNEISFSVESAEDSLQMQFLNAKQKIETDTITLIEYTDKKTPVKLRCNTCGNEWRVSYNIAIKHRSCPICKPVERTKTKSQKKPIISEQERQANKLAGFQAKIDQRSGYTLEVLEFVDSRSAAKVRCRKCGYEWSSRADHLLSRALCPKCKAVSFSPFHFG